MYTMATVIMGACLAISIMVIVYMSQKNYENIDIYYWTIVILVPIIILGYWLKTRVTTTEGALISFCYIYLDSTVLLAVILFCVLRFLGITPRRWVKVIVYAFTFIHLATFWLCIDNNLYYKKIELIFTDMGTVTKMVSGPLKTVHWIYLLFVIGSILGVVIIAHIRKGTYSRRTLYLYTVLVTIGICVYVIETVCDVDFSSLPVLYVTADILVAHNYDHAHTHDISCLISEQQKYHSNRGYAAFDLKGCYLSSNNKIYDFLPELQMQIVDEPLEKDSHLAGIFYNLIDEFKNGTATSKIFKVKDLICQCEITEFSIRKDGRIQGYLFDIRDVTEEQKVIKVMQDYNETLNHEVEEKTENIRNIQERVVLGLANMVENRDSNTGGHVKRTSDIIYYIVNEIRRQRVYDLDDELADDIVRAAPMHDLGKITVDNNILNKPGRLTQEEYEIMKTHSVKSGEFVNLILKDVEEKHFVDVAYNVARYHHERWDGRGYPEGLVGEMIPIEARIMAIADVYDALVSKRCYKKAMGFEEAALIMLEGMGTQFDPNMMSVFIGCRGELEKYYSADGNRGE